MPGLFGPAQGHHKTVTMQKRDQWENAPWLISASFHWHHRQSLLLGTPVFVAGDALTSLGCHHMMLQSHHDLFWWESLCMHLVNWAGIVTLSGDVKVDVLVTPIMKGEMGSPGTYHDAYTNFHAESLCSRQKNMEVVAKSVIITMTDTQNATKGNKSAAKCWKFCGQIWPKMPFSLK